ncbi:putative TIM-barrel fold metal-dependent hydrolase [Nakamurella sp. UYEF19]|uniref:amidohydrolase family protein n=1 Tax=Nakamurella sp. UYEF19 TaxID=1756392 RepID=UPI003397DB6A
MNSPDPFAGLIQAVPTGLADSLTRLSLIDHHVHGCFAGPISRATLEESLNEGSPDPIPPWMTQFDSQLGFAVRRWCAPVLGLEAHAEADDYVAARSSLGTEDLSRRMLTAAGVGTWVVDTGFAGDQIVSAPVLSTWSGGESVEIIRLESLAESLMAKGIRPRDYVEALRTGLRDLGPQVVGTKTVVAYRCGFDIDWAVPSSAEVVAAVQEWATEVAEGRAIRLTSPVLAAFGIHQAALAGLPIQFHVGFGDRDLDLHRVDPMLLLPLLRDPVVAAVPVLLLHCYPFQRQAGYLAQAFDQVYFDVGLSVNHVGARSTALLAESLELAPFAKQLYSSDAFGPPELHMLGAVLWRRGMGDVLGSWIRQGDWAEKDAIRVAAMIGRHNAERVYGL